MQGDWLRQVPVPFCISTHYMTRPSYRFQIPARRPTAEFMSPFAFPTYAGGRPGRSCLMCSQVGNPDIEHSRNRPLAFVSCQGLTPLSTPLSSCQGLTPLSECPPLPRPFSHRFLCISARSFVLFIHLTCCILTHSQSHNLSNTQIRS